MSETESRMGKWFTCTPKRFVGDHTFFARDSGLLCKGFQQAGYPCKSIMPGPPMDSDHTDNLIRIDAVKLEDPEWWKSLNAEGVVLYAWGDGKYWKIARAIHLSGAKLVSHMDTAGMLGIFNGLGAFTRSAWLSSSSTFGPGIRAIIHTTMRIAYAATIGIVRNDYRRLLHLNYADFIGAISPIAAKRIRKVCEYYGGNKLSSKIRLIPHPNASYMAYDPKIQKQRLICAIGRWDDKIIKGTDLLCRTSEQLLTRDSRACIEIYGRIPSMVLKWHHALHSDIRKRIILKGVVPNSELQPALQRASISLCTSLQESYHIVSAEALCCGCSVVGPDVETIPSLKWFTDGPHGQLAPRNPDALTASIIDELDKWDSGLRDPVAISQKWTAQLHAPNIARQIINLARA